jgi:transcriptional regulator with XRE-family HTH domain
MSPFATHLDELLRDRSVQQSHLAAMLAVNPAYISALKSGKKGPPSPEFINKLGKVLQLDRDAKRRLRNAVTLSQRSLKLPHDAPCEVYMLVADLRDQLCSMSPEEVRAIRVAVSRIAKPGGDRVMT